MQPPAGDPATDYIGARISRLRRWLADAGLGDPEAAALAAREEPMVSAEMMALAREALWHVRQIAYDALHRWSELAAGEAAPRSAAAEWVAMGLKSQPAT
jgi:hypothetical protein